MKIDYGNDINKKKRLIFEMGMREKMLVVRNIIKHR
jgi:hypothetical protein